MLRTTVGNLLINSALPEDLRSYNHILDKGGLQDLLRQVAERYPERYKEISHKLAMIGAEAASETGGFSPSLEHFRKAAAGRKYTQQLRAAVQAIADDDRLDDKSRRERIIKAVGAAQEPQMREILEESLGENNPLALQIVSGARGNKMNLASLRGADLLYNDARDNVIPLPVLRSYSEGLTPSEYFSGTYGARRGIVGVKLAVANAGYLGKRANQVAHRLVVTAHDADDADGEPSLRGLPVDTSDMDSAGALLAQAAGGYPRNTVLTPKILKDLERRQIARILVRSPTVGGPPEGGVYARDVGVREHGRLPGRGSLVGMSAAQALAEPISQGMLSSKHSGGVAGQEKTLGGYKNLDALLEAPHTIKGGATHAEVDGVVQKIAPAPAGGSLLTVEGIEHYIPPDVNLRVGKGDRVEAGDVLTDGLPNMGAIVQHKGIGEGRRYFTQVFGSALRDSGIKANRRNIELLARGLIDHVRLTEETDTHAPDDVMSYSALERSYTPRAGFKTLETRQAGGKYLERPVLHYSIGSKIRPSVLADLEQFGIKTVDVHDDPPPFQPEMIRAQASLRHDPDPLTRMYGSGLKTGLLDAVHRGAVSDELGTSFVPGLARAVDFGRKGILRPPGPGVAVPEPGTPLKMPDQEDDAGSLVSGSGLFKRAAYGGLLRPQPILHPPASSPLPRPPSPPAPAAAPTPPAPAAAPTPAAPAMPAAPRPPRPQLAQAQPQAQPAQPQAPPQPSPTGWMWDEQPEQSLLGAGRAAGILMGGPDRPYAHGDYTAYTPVSYDDDMAAYRERREAERVRQEEALQPAAPHATPVDTEMDLNPAYTGSGLISQGLGGQPMQPPPVPSAVQQALSHPAALGAMLAPAAVPLVSGAASGVNSLIRGVVPGGNAAMNWLGGTRPAVAAGNLATALGARARQAVRAMPTLAPLARLGGSAFWRGLRPGGPLNIALDAGNLAGQSYADRYDSALSSAAALSDAVHGPSAYERALEISNAQSSGLPVPPPRTGFRPTLGRVFQGAFGVLGQLVQPASTGLGLARAIGERLAPTDQTNLEMERYRRSPGTNPHPLQNIPSRPNWRRDGLSAALPTALANLLPSSLAARNRANAVLAGEGQTLESMEANRRGPAPQAIGGRGAELDRQRLDGQAPRYQELYPVWRRWLEAGSPENWADPQTGRQLSLLDHNTIRAFREQMRQALLQRGTPAARIGDILHNIGMMPPAQVPDPRSLSNFGINLAD